MNTIKAIETWHDGILYRSRAEARMAVFLTHAGIEFKYEYEGYLMSNGQRYLPDFILTGIDVFLEIKGGVPTADEIGKAEQLANDTYKAVFVHYGGFVDHPPEITSDSMLCVGPHGIIDNQFWFCECDQCGLVGIQWQGLSNRLSCGCQYELGRDKTPGYDTPKLIAAHEAAKSARFEF